MGNKIMLGYAACMAALIIFGTLALLVLGSLTDALRQRSTQREMQLYEVFSGLQDAGKCLAAGMDDYLAKPFKPRDLDLALAKYCSHRARQAS